MIGALVLAAGFSLRFGSDKRLYRRTPDAPPMLIETLQKYVSSFDVCGVVIRPDDVEITEIIENSFEERVGVLMSESAHLGMGASLASGVRKFGLDCPRLRALFVAHGDMPCVRTSSLITLRESIRNLPATIVRPESNGTPGHPVGFARRFFKEIAHLTGDTGARTILERHPNAVRPVNLQDPGVCLDFDTPS